MVGPVDPLALAGLEHLDQGREALDQLAERQASVPAAAVARRSSRPASSPAVTLQPLSVRVERVVEPGPAGRPGDLVDPGAHDGPQLDVEA